MCNSRVVPSNSRRGDNFCCSNSQSVSLMLAYLKTCRRWKEEECLRCSRRRRKRNHKSILFHIRSRPAWCKTVFYLNGDRIDNLLIILSAIKTTHRMHTSEFLGIGAVAILALAICTVSTAQPKSDSTRKSGSNGKGPKPYKEVVPPTASSDWGLFTVHKVEDRYLFEIGDSLLGRDILVVNRISRASAGMRNGFFGYAGDQIGQNVIRFEKGPNNKVFLRTVSFAEYAKDSTSPMFTVVNNSNVQPIAASFDIKAFSR